MEGTAPLDIEGKMLAMVLVTWAASFGIDEFGKEDSEDAASQSHNNPHFTLDGDANPKRRARMLRTEAMTREILTLVDIHGLLRRPSWDGVRVLLLLLPLTHGQSVVIVSDCLFIISDRHPESHRTSGKCPSNYSIYRALNLR